MTDPRFKYGDPQMILIHATPQPKYPTEIEACLRGYNPQDARFTPAPPRTDIWCPGCCKMKKPDLFHASRNRPTGRHPYCKACRKAGIEKAGRKRTRGPQWYRAS